MGLILPNVDISYQNSWAVVIGINDYESNKINDLNYAVSDASGIKQMLIDYYEFPEENIISLINENATARNIRKEISGLSKKTTDKDRIVIFFAGHGMTEDLPSGGEMGYLVPYDGDLEELYLSSVPMKELRDLSDRFEARHVLFLVDACYGGLAAVGTRGLSSTIAGYYDKIFRGKSRQIITAGGKGETVLEDAKWGHSAFTFNLLRGLKDWMADLDNDGYITGEELGIYLKKRVTEDSQLHQTPTIGRFTTDQGEVMFARPAKLGGIVKNNDIKSTNANSASIQNELEKIKAEKEKLLSKLNQAKPSPIKNLSTGKKLSILYPGIGHFYMGQNKMGAIWSIAGTASLIGTAMTYSSYNKRAAEFDIANDYYLSTGENKDNQILTYDKKKSAFNRFLATSILYSSTVIFNYFTLNSKSDDDYSQNPITGSINENGELKIIYNF